MGRFRGKGKELGGGYVIEGIGWGEEWEGWEVEDMGVKKELWTNSPFLAVKPHGFCGFCGFHGFNGFRGPKILKVLLILMIFFFNAMSLKKFWDLWLYQGENKTQLENSLIISMLKIHSNILLLKLFLRHPLGCCPKIPPHQPFELQLWCDMHGMI